MTSHTYMGSESVEYPSLGIFAEPGQSYELPDGVDAPEDGRWSVAAGVQPDQPQLQPPSPVPVADVPELVGELPSPEPGTETAPDAVTEPTTIGD